MKTNLLFAKSLLAVMLCAFLFSCSSSVNISKKRYSSGYYVSITNKEKTTEQNKVSLKHSNVEVKTKKVSLAEEEVVATVVEGEVAEINNVNSEKKAQEANSVEMKTVAAAPTVSAEPIKAMKNVIKKNKKERKGIDNETLLLLILCFFLPPLAVGLKTNWETTPLLISILLTLLVWVPGVVYALLVVTDSI